MRCALVIMDELAPALLRLHEFEAILTYIKVTPMEWDMEHLHQVSKSAGPRTPRHRPAPPLASYHGRGAMSVPRLCVLLRVCVQLLSRAVAHTWCAGAAPLPPRGSLSDSKASLDALARVTSADALGSAPAGERPGRVPPPLLLPTATAQPHRA